MPVSLCLSAHHAKCPSHGYSCLLPVLPCLFSAKEKFFCSTTHADYHRLLPRQGRQVVQACSSVLLPSSACRFPEEKCHHQTCCTHHVSITIMSAMALLLATMPCLIRWLQAAAACMPCPAMLSQPHAHNAQKRSHKREEERVGKQSCCHHEMPGKHEREGNACFMLAGARNLEYACTHVQALSRRKIRKVLFSE